MHPFVFFPIVPPYSQWHPELGTNVPECTAVCEQMEKVSPEAQPFISTWYCMEFLKHCAITNPSGFKYSTLASNLDAMLLWSFHIHVPLLDWKEQQVQRFLDFYCDPPVGCTGSAVHSRFVEECSVPFRDWAINPEWRLFRRTASGPGSLTPITRESCKRLAAHLQHFFDFYRSFTGSSRANPAEEVTSITSRLSKSKSLVVLTEKQLDWLFTDALSSRVHARQSLQVMVYLGLARYTNLTAKQIIGNFNAGFTLDRLRLESDGGWSLAKVSNGVSESWMRLPKPMTPLIQRYLQSRHVDLSRPLPNLPLFPQLNGVDAYNFDSMSSYVQKLSKLVANAASADGDPDIAASAEVFRKVAFSVVRRSSRCAQG
ncbi:hypothetical protein [Pseudomonas guariconensis]|uniref:hypothetical protein n=1 Tax=Pseudomonas guariconensis TaxID=1288410 RepID=UPI0034D53952